MKCSFCGGLEPGKQLPQGWKVSGPLIVCRECQLQRYRARTITMAVVEPLGAEPQDFTAALEKAWNQTPPLHIQNGAWQLVITAGRRLVRMSIGNRWWALPLRGPKWSRGRRITYESIASGKAVTGELLVYRRSTFGMRGENGRSTLKRPPPGIVCKTVAWLPREQQEATRHQSVLSPRNTQLDPGIRKQNIQEIEIGILREAIRANWVSFPSQVPVFPSCGQRDLQPKLVQLYFVLGWKCASIASRYRLPPTQVRQVLSAWRCRAASAGYIQHIPAAFPAADSSCCSSDFDCAIQPEHGPSDARLANLGDDRGDPFKSVHGLIHTEGQSLPFRMNRKIL